MITPDSLNLVAQFHTTFKSPILTTPTIPSIERVRLRIKLLKEELEELEDAIADEDIIGVADAFADLQYVLSGAILEFGLGEKFNAIFNEVQRSNMSKACPTELCAQNTLVSYQKLGQEGYYEEQSDGTWLVFRDGDHKTLKSISYSPADLEPIVNG